MKNPERDEFKVTVDRNLERFILTEHRDASQIWFGVGSFAAIYEAKYPWEKPIMQVVNYTDIPVSKLLGTNLLESNTNKLPQLTVSDRLRYNLPSKYSNIIQLHFYYQQSVVYMTVCYLDDDIEYNDTWNCMNLNERF